MNDVKVRHVLEFNRIACEKSFGFFIKVFFKKIMIMKEIKIVCKNEVLPIFATENSAGMDLSACIDKDVEICPNNRVLIPTGLYIQLPEGYEAQIRSRSGLAMKYGVVVLNAPGTIDADYRGEIGVLLHNFGELPFVVHNGDRIAQMVIAKYEKVSLRCVDSLDDTNRSSGGWGHTGI